MKTDTNNNNNKTKSKMKPFRVKPSSIVAFRYKPPPSSSHSSSSSVSFTEAWLDPMPGRDINYNLIGKYIRCMFPKVEKNQERIVEGEIIHCHYFMTNTGTGRSTSCDRDRDRNRDRNSSKCDEDGIGFQVNLLIDKVYIVKMPFLIQYLVHENDHRESNSNTIGNNISNGTIKNNVSKAEQRKRDYEEQIRGKDKVIITILLADIISSSSTKTDTTNATPVKWVIRKWIPIHNNNNKSSSSSSSTNSSRNNKTKKEQNHSLVPCFEIGNDDDDTIQKEKNYRWLASLSSSWYYHQHHHFHHEQQIQHYTIGEVLKVKLNNHDDICTIPNENNNDKKKIKKKQEKKRQRSLSPSTPRSSLATVTIKRMILPESTYNGRLAHHHPNEIFDLDDDGNNNDNHESNNGTIQIPIEDLIVIGRKVHRVDTKYTDDDDNDNDNQMDKILSIDHESKSSTNELFVRYKYNTNENSFQLLYENGKNDNDENGVMFCHRCRRKSNSCSNFMRQCSHHYSDIKESTRTGSAKLSSCCNQWWCNVCCQSFHNETAIIQSQNEWIGPCCLGICDCSYCKSRLPQLKKRKSFHDSIYDWVLDKGRDNEEGVGEMDASFCRTCGCMIVIGGDATKVLYSSCSKCSRKMHCSCFNWEASLQLINLAMKGESGLGEKGNETNEDIESSICISCSWNTVDVMKNKGGGHSNDSLINLTRALLDAAPPCDFELPFNFLGNQIDLYDNTALQQSKRQKKKITHESRSLTTEEEMSKLDDVLVTNGSNNITDDKTNTCSRCISIHTIGGGGVRQPNNSAAHARQSLALLRKVGRKLNTSEIDTKKTAIISSGSSRAARASQRRRNKAYEGLGLETKNMAGKEEVLRFGKSLIHGWGVFTDGHINAGDLIVEYRGILIGNKVADKREKEYEKAKIGSDYMFRIDADTVCDATRHGNVARFINASCTPNCYTQIITVNGCKRIAIYAKKDIMPGEELSYDYKFEPEFVESKRIRKLKVRQTF